uniref:protein translocase subunit SecF n=1 Tax=Vaginimicrobium propionicum TaxID=1871034 RepID=UPI0009703B98|nr:protein translocase subunit SecF [Vaginimicrobium propionicum]
MTETRVSEKTVEAKEGFVKRLYTSNFNVPFIAKRKVWFIFSAIVLLICIGSFFIRGFNWGIEFQGGSVFQASTQVNEQTVAKFTSAVADTGIADLNTQVSTLSSQGVRVQTRSLNTDEIVQVREAIAEAAGIDRDNVTYTLIGPSWGKQITQKAFLALGVFILLVFGLIWIYFKDWRSSVSAIVALIHDVLVTMGVISLFGFTVTPATLIGVLTVFGYSLYDTVVVFDKVSENTANLTRQKRTYNEGVNLAINQVLTRSINTTVIVLLPVLAIFLAGLIWLNGEGPLADLGLSLFVGMVAGAYSSLFLAAPLASIMRQRDPVIAKHTADVLRSRKKAEEKAEMKPAAENEVEVEKLEPQAVVRRVSGERIQPRRAPRSQRKKH